VKPNLLSLKSELNTDSFVVDDHRKVKAMMKPESRPYDDNDDKITITGTKSNTHTLSIMIILITKTMTVINGN